MMLPQSFYIVDIHVNTGLSPILSRCIYLFRLWRPARTTIIVFKALRLLDANHSDVTLVSLTIIINFLACLRLSSRVCCSQLLSCHKIRAWPVHWSVRFPFPRYALKSLLDLRSSVLPFYSCILEQSTLNRSLAKCLWVNLAIGINLGHSLSLSSPCVITLLVETSRIAY